MVFNSIPFVLFFVVFFILYWLVLGKSLKAQNLLILLGSYVFYAWYNWHFLFLIIGSSILNYYLGILIGKAETINKRNFFVGIGLVQGLGCLVFFKYSNFCIGTVNSILQQHIHALDILLPLGISFYTFRMISYLLDIRNNKVQPTTNWVVFFSYVAFFPALVAGPIDRPKTLIPQLEKERVFDIQQATDGMRQILWGLFKKIVIADNCAFFTGEVFQHYTTLPASSLLLGMFLLTIQIYADFSGYSDIAIGIAGLMGLKITRNFNNPFFAQNIPDFWRRWHISLTSWLTAYVFTPLLIWLRDLGKTGIILAVLINFTIIGIWHGPNWTFVLFGILHGCYFIPVILFNKFDRTPKIPKDILFPSLGMLLRIVSTFILVMLAFVIFKADSIAQAFDYFGHLLSPTIFSKPPISEKWNLIIALLSIAVMFVAEWLQRDKQHALQIDGIRSFAVRASIYYGLVLVILSFAATKNVDFIYIKF